MSGRDSNTPPPGSSRALSPGNRPPPARRRIVRDQLLRSWLYSPELLCQLTYRSTRRSGPQQKVRRGREVQSECGVETARPRGPLYHRDNRAASARDDLVVEAGPPGLEPGPTRLELAVLPLHHRPMQSGRPGSNGPPRSGAPVLFLLSYVRENVRPAGVEPAASAVAEQRSLR